MTTSTLDVSIPGIPAKELERHERARKAYIEARKLMRDWRSLARMLARDQSIELELTPTRTETNGKTIYIKVPMELGNDSTHQISQCGQRGEDLVLTCPRCAVIEDANITVIHEVSHIVQGTFAEIDPNERTQIIKRAIDLECAGSDTTTRAGKIKARIDSAPDYRKQDYLNLAGLVSPFLSVLINACEDIRVDGSMQRERPGTKVMYRAQKNKVFNEGILRADGTYSKWTDAPPNAQAMIGVYCLTWGTTLDGKVSDKVVEDLKDPEIVDLVARMKNCQSVHEVYKLSFPLLEALRRLGYMKAPEDEQDEPEPEPEPEQENNEEDEGSGDSEDTDGLPDGDGDRSDQKENGNSDTHIDAESERHEGDDPESDTSDDSGSEVPDGADQDDEGSDETGTEESIPDNTRLNDESGNAGEQEDSQPESSEQNESEPTSTHDQDSKSVENEPTDQSSDDSGESDGEPSSDEEAGEPSDSPLQDGDSDDEGDGAESPDSGDEAESSGSDAPGQDPGNNVGDGSGQPGTGTETGQDSTVGPQDSGENGEPQHGAMPGDSGPGMPGKDSGDYTPEQLESDGTPEEVQHLFGVFGCHKDDDEKSYEERLEESKDEQALQLAINQTDRFDLPSRQIHGLLLHTYKDMQGQLAWGKDSLYTAYGTFKTAPIKVPERILVPSLQRLRLVFTDNARGSSERNLKSGKVNGRALAKRVPVGDDRLFKKNRRPGKKDYFVVIGIDCSGSTTCRLPEGGNRLDLIKTASHAKAELLHRLGIPFSMYAHSGDGYNVELFEIKGPKQPWSKQTQKVLAELQPYAANLDGHTMEFYRKAAQARHETDRLILYFTDGAMPAENYTEEKMILEAEIEKCKKLNIHLVGIGVQTDAPTEYGLDTIQLDSIADVPKVVDGLRKRLAE